jgi:hypothetical protein
LFCYDTKADNSDENDTVKTPVNARIVKKKYAETIKKKLISGVYQREINSNEEVSAKEVDIDLVLSF